MLGTSKVKHILHLQGISLEPRPASGSGGGTCAESGGLPFLLLGVAVIFHFVGVYVEVLFVVFGVFFTSLCLLTC